MENKKKQIIPKNLSEFLKKNTRENCCQCGKSFDFMGFDPFGRCPQCNASVLSVWTGSETRYLLLTVPEDSLCSW